MKVRHLLCLTLAISWLLLSSCAGRKTAHINGSAPSSKAPSAPLHPLLGVPLPANTNPVLLSSLVKWWAVPYKLGGNSKAGIDCSGLIAQLYKEVFQMQVPRTTAALWAQAQRNKPDTLQTGDLVFFSINTSQPVHAGLYLWDGYFYHASTSRGVMVSNLQEPYWKKYFSGAGRIAKPTTQRP